MTSTLVDSNVLLDIIDRSPWMDWSARRLAAARDAGTVVINQIILAETAARFRDAAAAEASAFARIERESLPWEAAFQAGQAHQLYRNAGGERERTLPDFLIGAHAMTKGHQLLTRDPRRYRRYFTDLDIIAPDTHP
jgi:predicted nucleic acid-binding protein